MVLTQFFASTFACASMLFNLFVFLAPIGPFHVGLVTLKTSKSGGSKAWMGLLGSCVESNSSSEMDCTKQSFPPKYNLSAISGDSTPFDVAVPSAAATGVACSTLILSILFFVSGILVGGRRETWVRIMIMSFGLASLCIGSFEFMFLRVMFAQAIRDFNRRQGSDPRAKAFIGATLKTFAAITYILLALALVFQHHRCVHKHPEKTAEAKGDEATAATQAPAGHLF